MNRDIKFRGRRLDNGAWYYGFYFYIESTVHDDHIIQISDGNGYQVDPETVGQYTGLKDKNGKEIYEGDILTWNQNTNVEVKFIKGVFGAVFNHDPETINIWVNLTGREVIGNIHENPELL